MNQVIYKCLVGQRSNNFIIQQKNIYHGYQSIVRVTKESKLFNKNKIFKVGRYHSLKLFEPFKSNNIKISMRCAKTNIPMGIEDLKDKVRANGNGAH